MYSFQNTPNHHKCKHWKHSNWEAEQTGGEAVMTNTMFSPQVHPCWNADFRWLAINSSCRKSGRGVGEMYVSQSLGENLTDSHMFPPWVPASPSQGTASRLITNKATGSIHLRAPQLPFSQLPVRSCDAAADVCHLETHDWTTEWAVWCFVTPLSQNSQARSLTLRVRSQFGLALHHDSCGPCKGLWEVRILGFICDLVTWCNSVWFYYIY